MYHVFEHILTHTRIYLENFFYRLVECLDNIATHHFLDKLAWEDFQVGEVFNNDVVFFQIECLVNVGHDDAGRYDKLCSVFVEFTVAHFEQDRDQLVHPLIEFLLCGHGVEEVKRLHTDRVDRMCGTADALVFEEVVKAAVVVSDQCVDTYIHLYQVES